MSDENKAQMRRFYDEVLHKGNLDAIDELCTEDFVDHDPFPGQGPGSAGVKQAMEMMRTGFPDIQVTIEDQIAEGDLVVARGKFGGTHEGEFFGVPATGKKMEVSGIDIIRMENGKAAEHWGLIDSAAMMEQLGVSPG